MTALVDDVTELLILIPHLGEALERDAGTSGDPVVSGRPDPAFRLPVNADVLAAVHTLDARVPALALWAAEAVAEPPRGRSIEGHLRHMARWHERMLVTAAPEHAAHLVDEVATVLRAVKLALGLRTPDRRLGQFCPLHDEPLRELIAPGSDGHVRRGAAGPVVEWTYREAALCRHCGGSWVSGPPMLTLGRLMREADARRVAAEAPA